MSIVVHIWLWPSSFVTTRGWTFSLSSKVAAVCLRRGPRLLPGSVSAGGRTPLGDRSTVLRGDRPTARPTGPRRGPSLATGHLGIGALDPATLVRACSAR